MGSDFVFDFRRNGLRFRLQFSPEWVSISSSILPEWVPISSSIFAGMGSDFVSVKFGCSSNWFRFRLRSHLWSCRRTRRSPRTPRRRCRSACWISSASSPEFISFVISSSASSASSVHQLCLGRERRERQRGGGREKIK
jgi:hypothetical protein